MSEDTIDNESGSGKVFLVLGLMIGAGLGAGGGFYFFGGGSTTDDSEAPVQEKVVQEALIPIPFERIAVPIYAKRGTSRRYIGNFFIDLNANVRGAENQITVKRSMSQLQHSFISAISKADLMREDSPTELDIDKTSKVLKEKAAEVVGVGIVESVTITKSMRIAN